MKEIMFCDIESHGLYLEICLFQYVGVTGEAKVKAYPSSKWLFKFLKKYHTVWYNGSYDFGTITHQAKKSLGLDYNFDDLFYAGRTAYPELERYSLDILHDYLGMKFYDKNLDKSKMQKSFTYAEAKKTRVATQDQLDYAKADVYTVRGLWGDKKIRKVVKKNKSYALSIESMKYALVYQMNGIPVNTDALHKEQEKLTTQIEHNAQVLGAINPQSPKQCVEALGVPKTDKPTLVRLISQGNKLAKTIFDQRRLLKAKKMLETWDFDRVHTFFNVSGTVTTRFSASGGDVGEGYVNTQQISRQYQYIFRSVDKKRITFEVDYGTAELRAGCSLMQDETMYAELMLGADLHIEATKLTGIENPTKADRQKGKAVSFGLIFGMSAPTFQDYAFTNYGVVFSLNEAKAIHRKYHKKYRGISKYARARWHDYKNVPVVSAMGARNIARLGTDAINYATQASTAEATKWSVVFLVRKYPKALDLIINVVHDAVYLDCKKKDFDKWSKRLQDCMVLGWLEVCKSDLMYYKDIPMPVEVEIIGDLG